MDAQDTASRACNDAHEWQELKAEREAKRKAEAAPDREKLFAFAHDVAEMKLPPMGSLKARDIRHEVEERMRDLAAWIRGKAGEL